MGQLGRSHEMLVFGAYCRDSLVCVPDRIRHLFAIAICFER